ncbi:hypothetical protein AcV7_001138 [Taiwanofungus camphoratus]|nr:hypothetical protein AcV7_001138 [Antrodia cinnamomea]
MFTVKATYHNETRKFTFPDPAYFPSYEQLYHQLYRVFPISHSFYLSKLLFSPNPTSTSQRILIGVEAHSADEYGAHIAPYQGRTWPGALLKFSVYDETPHKSPRVVDSNRVSMLSTADSDNTGATASEGASQSSATVVDWSAAVPRRRKTEERRLFLERLRERTTSRFSISSQLPPSPPRSPLRRSPPRLSQPLLSTSRSHSQSSRPLPQRPSSRGSSDASARTARTVRPSLFDLLAREPVTTDRLRSTERGVDPAPRQFIQLQSSHDPHPSSSTSEPEQRHSWDGFIAPPPPPPPPPPIMLSQGTSSSCFPLVIPPPPILYPSMGIASSQSETQQPSRTEYDDVMVSPIIMRPPSFYSPQSLETAPQPHNQAQYQGPQRQQREDTRTSAQQPHISGSQQPTASHCCSVSQGKAEVRTLLANFMTDIDRTMKAAFGNDWTSDNNPRVSFPGSQSASSREPASRYRSSTSWRVHEGAYPSYVDVCSLPPPVPPSTSLGLVPPLPSSPPISYHSSFTPLSPRQVGIYPHRQSQHNRGEVAATETELIHWGITCDGCHTINLRGVRFKCNDCPNFDLCITCISSNIRDEHPIRHSFHPIRKAHDLEQIIHVGIHCNVCDVDPIVGVRYKCLECDDYDLCAGCLSSASQREKHDLSHAFFPIETPGNMDIYRRAYDLTAISRSSFPRSVAPPPPVLEPSGPALVVHKNIICDVCSREIVGVRHKCLDCPDYDLCGQCICSPGVRTKHGLTHQFFEIDRPGEVIVHTVFSGDGEREPHIPLPPRRSRWGSQARAVSHNASCNMCDSRIYGDRYKCLNCPDFDTCWSCYRITPEQHPGHGFVKVKSPDQLEVSTGASSTKTTGAERVS